MAAWVDSLPAQRAPTRCAAIGIVVALCAISCTTKRGEITSAQPGTGSLIVNSSVSGAHLFLDYRDTGLRTPALVPDLLAGPHTVHLILAGHRAAPELAHAEIRAGEETRVDFSLTVTPSVGGLAVQSTPPNALVYLDELPFGRTPLTINGIISGTHSVRLIRGGYRTIAEAIRIETNQQVEMRRQLVLEPQLVQVEHFSNTDCAPCPEADEVIERVLQEKDVDSTSVVSYHPDFPGRQDPFFLAAAQENLARYGYYSRPPLPFVAIDGVLRMAGTFDLESRFRGALAQRSGIAARATLDFWELLESWQTFDVIAGRVRIEALADLNDGDVVLHVALIEREVAFAVAPGSNGQKRFFDVMRALHTAPGGETVQLAPGQSAFFAFHFARQPEWQDELEVVAFLQNNATSEILQSIWSARYRR